MNKLLTDAGIGYIIVFVQVYLLGKRSLRITLKEESYDLLRFMAENSVVLTPLKIKSKLAPAPTAEPRYSIQIKNRAGQTVTALYEIVPAQGYASGATAATFDVRYKKALGTESRPLSLEVTVPGATLANSPEFHFAAGIAAFSLSLRNSQYKGSASYGMASELVKKGSKDIPDPLKLRSQLLELIDAASKIQE